jgi:hypothetical protein
MKKIRSFLKDEQGNVMVIVAVGMVALIGMVGLVIDLGRVYVEKSDLKKEATTAVLSASQELTNTETRVNDVLGKIISSYDDPGEIESTQIEMNKQVSVTLKKYVPYTFMSIFGLDGTTLHVDASAKIAPVGTQTGAVPLGIDDSINLVFGQTYTLKVGPGDSTYGNFGILALDGPGAKSYYETLKSGYDEPLTVGDVIDTQTGDISGYTREGVNYRIANCPYPEGDTFERNCSRIMPIIVYTPNTYNNNQMTSIKITGFAYFYLLAPGDDSDVIKGMFIKRVGNGTYGSEGLDKGAYTARLVE